MNPMSRRAALLALAAVLALGLVGSSVASPVDKGRGAPRTSGGGSSSGATVTASPNPVAAWSAYTISGCGYIVGKQVTIVINNGTFFAVAVAANGCMTPTTWWASGPGSYRINAYQRPRGRKQILMATTMQRAV